MIIYGLVFDDVLLLKNRNEKIIISNSIKNLNVFKNIIVFKNFNFIKQ